MNQLILASHGGLAEGARDTLAMVLGDVSNVHTVTLARDDKEPSPMKSSDSSSLSIRMTPCMSVPI